MYEQGYHVDILYKCMTPPPQKKGTKIVDPCKTKNKYYVPFINCYIEKKNIGKKIFILKCGKNRAADLKQRKLGLNFSVELQFSS